MRPGHLVRVPVRGDAAHAVELQVVQGAGQGRTEAPAQRHARERRAQHGAAQERERAGWQAAGAPPGAARLSLRLHAACAAAGLQAVFVQEWAQYEAACFVEASCMHLILLFTASTLVPCACLAHRQA